MCYYHPLSVLMLVNLLTLRPASFRPFPLQTRHLVPSRYRSMEGLFIISIATLSYQLECLATINAK
jgi:hypothetical protein